MPFTSVTSTLTVGRVGQAAYSVDDNLLVEGFALIDATDIPPGRGVVYDQANSSATVNACKLPAGSIAGFLGVAIDDNSLPIDQAGYTAAGVNRVPVLQRGKWWVTTSEAVTATSDVYMTHTAGGAGAVGTFRTDNDGGKAAQITNARFDGTYGSGKAALQLNNP